MGLTSAMYTGLTGLNVNQSRIETIGNNVANVNTNAFRGSRTLFQTQFYQALSMGSPPNNDSGGTNPMQIGHGAMVGTTHRTNAPGALETTGLAGDMAIEGAGFFIVRDPDGRALYTRDGAFSLDANNQLVTVNGHHVRGYGVDQDFNIQTGALTDLTVPIGMRSIARASENVAFDGDLSAAETIATTGAETRSQALVTGGGTPATSDTALTDLRDATAAGVPLFADGDTITVSNISKGGRDLPAQTFVVGTDGATLGDFASWLQTRTGIQTYDGVAGSPGVTVDNGQLIVRSNAGQPNAIAISANDIRSDNPVAARPFTFTETVEAQGSGIFTSFTVYDSLGAPVQVNATFTLDSTPNSGPVWRYYLESGDPETANRALGTGTVAFDTQGNFVSATGNQVSVDRANSGATTPLAFEIDFSAVNGLSTQTSNVILAEQDGYPPGELIAYGVETDGTLMGTFSNGQSLPVGQLALATFTNETGLVAESENLFSVAPNSGEPRILTAGQSGAGLVRGGTLEMSNVDLANEFIGLITSSTAFQAASRVISTSNEMLDQLLVTLR